jgi:hypothetical protein
MMSKKEDVERLLERGKMWLDEARDFLKMAEGSNEEFHEPDNAGIEVKDIIGNHLDNAMGTEITLKSKPFPSDPEYYSISHHQEYLVFVGKDGKVSYERYIFNLANIFALAKLGAKTLIEENHKRKS